jgi:hypothetical protein
VRLSVMVRVSLLLVSLVALMANPSPPKWVVVRVVS